MSYGLMGVAGIVQLALIAFVLVLLWRVMRALERIAVCMERDRAQGGPEDLGT
ncbi:MAG TPA: hypothetical protein VM100_11860 [Longimicrobiales bacterium]|nr:hypothetical protein [Longimicrobiales bacterium]